MVDTDTAIMERLRDGDDDALADLVERYQDELVGFFYHQCWDQSTAEDLAQTVFIKVFRARERYQATAKVRTYLYRIARNAWIDHLRRRKPTISLDADRGHDGFTLADTLEANTVDPERAARSGVVRERIQTAVEGLSQGQRDVFVLANSHDMTYVQIGEVLGIPEGTVKSRMHAAVRALRRQLADLVDA